MSGTPERVVMQGVLKGWQNGGEVWEGGLR